LREALAEGSLGRLRAPGRG